MNQLDLDVQSLNKYFSKLTPEEIIKECLKKFGKKITYICSFGTESAIILDMIAKINKNFPIFLLSTNFLFPETIAYKEELLRKLKLTNCIDIFPEKRLLDKEDPNDDLWTRNTDRCCELRKVLIFRKEYFLLLFRNSTQDFNRVTNSRSKNINTKNRH